MFKSQRKMADIFNSGALVIGQNERHDTPPLTKTSNQPTNQSISPLWLLGGICAPYSRSPLTKRSSQSNQSRPRERLAPAPGPWDEGLGPVAPAPGAGPAPGGQGLGSTPPRPFSGDIVTKGVGAGKGRRVFSVTPLRPGQTFIFHLPSSFAHGILSSCPVPANAASKRSTRP